SQCPGAPTPLAFCASSSVPAFTNRPFTTKSQMRRGSDAGYRIGKMAFPVSLTSPVPPSVDIKLPASSSRLKKFGLTGDPPLVTCVGTTEYPGYVIDPGRLPVAASIAGITIWRNPHTPPASGAKVLYTATFVGFEMSTLESNHVLRTRDASHAGACTPKAAT